jgi:hypothetical protein
LRRADWPQSPMMGEDTMLPLVESLKRSLSLFAWICGLAALWVLTLLILMGSQNLSEFSFDITLRGTNSPLTFAIFGGEKFFQAILRYAGFCFIAPLPAALCLCLLRRKLPRQFWYASQCASFVLGLGGLLGILSLADSATRESFEFLEEIKQGYIHRAVSEADVVIKICKHNSDKVGKNDSADAVCETAYKVGEFLKGPLNDYEWKKLQEKLPPKRSSQEVCIHARPPEVGIVDLENEYDVPINVTCRLSMSEEALDDYVSAQQAINQNRNSRKGGMLRDQWTFYGGEWRLRFLAFCALAFIAALNFWRVMLDYFQLLEK